jgi:ankyrin repeat protein
MEILIQLSGFTMAHFLLFYLLLHTSDTLAKPCTKCLLLQAASIGDVHAFKKHLFNGCDINQMDQMGTTALYYASENNYPSIVKIILNQDKVNIDAAPTLSGATPLFIAIQEGHYEIFNLLLNAGSNTTISTSNNVTPLMIASHSTKDDYLKPLLLSSQHVRQSVNTASPTTGHTVLHMSAMKGSMENVKVLLKYAGGFTDCNQVNSVNGATGNFLTFFFKHILHFIYY